MCVACRKKQANAAAAALPLALTCGQIQRKCGRCKQSRWLNLRAPKTSTDLEKDAAKRNKKKDAADEACRREAADDEKIKFMCRHAVGDEVTRPPALFDSLCVALNCVGWCRLSFSTVRRRIGPNASTTDG